MWRARSLSWAYAGMVYRRHSRISIEIDEIPRVVGISSRGKQNIRNSSINFLRRVFTKFEGFPRNAKLFFLEGKRKNIHAPSTAPPKNHPPMQLWKTKRTLKSSSTGRIRTLTSASSWLGLKLRRIIFFFRVQRLASKLSSHGALLRCRPNIISIKSEKEAFVDVCCCDGEKQMIIRHLDR